MQWGEVRCLGSGCPRTRSGKHHFEDQEDDETWWCRMCSIVVTSDYVERLTEEQKMNREMLKAKWEEGAQVGEDYITCNVQNQDHHDTARLAWEKGAKWAWATALQLAGESLIPEAGEFCVRITNPKGHQYSYTFKPDDGKLSTHLRTLADNLDAEEAKE